MRKAIILAFMCLLAMTATAQNITNARFVQDGKIVKIYYDLSEEADISIFLSTDGGKTYESSPLGHLSGHAGEGVAAGTNRCAVWDVLADREKLQSANVRFKVVAARRSLNEIFTVGGVRFTMVYVEGGTFTMGCTSEQEQDCDPAHSVTLSDYYIGETEVTQALWKAVMGTTVRQQRDKEASSMPGYNIPMSGEGDNYPMYYVSWKECQKFCRKLSQKTGHTFRLPTEAEWEYAARGGNKSHGYKYSGSDNLSSVAWYDSNSSGQTHPVKGKQANELGLYDMSGNVWEWCQDWYGDYDIYSQANPTGPSSGSRRVLRGCGWAVGARYFPVARRASDFPSIRNADRGLRIVLVR